MSVYQLCFIFGGIGVYVLDHPKRLTRICGDLGAFLEAPELESIVSLAMNASSDWFCVYTGTDKRGNTVTRSRTSKGFGSRDIRQFLKKNGRRNCKAAFGSSPDEWLLYSSDDWMTSVAVSQTNEQLNEALHTVDDTGQTIKSVSLGINQSYVVLCTDGDYYYKVKMGYPELWDILDKSERGDVVYVALNPYRRNEFFVALANNQVHIRASALCEAHVVEVLSDYPQLDVITTELSNFSNNVAPTPQIPQTHRRKEYLQGIAKAAGGGVGTAVATTAMTMMCEVM
ncbi:uncharacterized protein AB675_7587 [Cyphellophora attinorum]|uniref:Uncharacterized protein n=1 Tax=Cyphellophora attinorum TaxID=1664694 RepID=A0A0N1HB61_9EURO|nr:uncharacterized protein AB675_7587 [Phialophora attinorum]KPI40290.1 hypothetical protein AB675_7587 [Phialophora attinorum]